MNADEWLDEVLDLDPPGWRRKERRRDWDEEEVEVIIEHETLHYERDYHYGKARR
jgi:hypothetical protein